MTKTRKTKTVTAADSHADAAFADLEVKPTDEVSPDAADSEPNAEPEPAGPAEPMPALAAKPTSKQQQLASLVLRDEGATLVQMVTLTASRR